jgi:short-subunit dehydrogenase
VSTALVTGATAGLGASFARQLADDGDDLVLVARDADRLAAAQARLQADHRVAVEVIPADLSTVDGCARVEDRIADPERPLDLLVNNAGRGSYHSFGRSELADEENLLDLNVRAVLRLTHAAVRAMRTRGRGCIVNVASVAGFVPRADAASYGASKAYVIALSEALSGLLRGTGVTVTAVCPGVMHTEFHERAGVDMSGVPAALWLRPDEVARQGLADARRGKPVSVPDVRYKAVVTLSRHLPRQVARRMGRVQRSRARR